MTTYGIADSLHRLVKQAVDSGAAASIAEAEAMFNGFRVCFRIGPNEARHPLHQAALLTGVALAKRVFLGGVEVSGDLDVPLLVPILPASTLSAAVATLGGAKASGVEGLPVISIGGETESRTDHFHVRCVFAGWRGGIVPGHHQYELSGVGSVALAPMLSAALAVNEAFLHVAQNLTAAGRRVLGMSLWRPSASEWLEHDDDEPELRYLPSRLWLIGLGHLGQAYLWALGLLPYQCRSGLSLVLQDVDRFTPSSESTCVLSDFADIGMMKTRALASWAENRGFETAICERMFDASFRRRDDEPAIALCGIDNAHGRRGLDQVGFDFVVEAGLGKGHQDFRCIRMHSLPGPRAANELWTSDRPNGRDITSLTPYRKLLADGSLDQCGVTLLAGKAVGAPFVGAVAACLVVSEVLRLLHGGNSHDLIEMDLQSMDYRSVVISNAARPANCGFVLATGMPY